LRRGSMLSAVFTGVPEKSRILSVGAYSPGAACAIFWGGF